MACVRWRDEHDERDRAYNERQLERFAHEDASLRDGQDVEVLKRQPSGTMNFRGAVSPPFSPATSPPFALSLTRKVRRGFVSLTAVESRH